MHFLRCVIKDAAEEKMQKDKCKHTHTHTHSLSLPDDLKFFQNSQREFSMKESPSEKIRANLLLELSFNNCAIDGLGFRRSVG